MKRYFVTGHSLSAVELDAAKALHKVSRMRLQIPHLVIHFTLGPLVFLTSFYKGLLGHHC